jgi:tRNA(Ile)-lysidine synthase
LLQDWCRRHHLLHLLLAHHQNDQAETLLIRLARGSGVDGLAAMAPAAFRKDLQLLRPLLGTSGKSLRAYLRACGQGWIEDPSNRADRFDRVRWRKIISEQRLSSERLAMTAAQMGRARQALEAAQASLAVEAIDLRPQGFAWLDYTKLCQAPREIALRTLAALTRCIGGQEFPPRLEGLERLFANLSRRRTFAGCVLAPLAGRVLVHREVRAVAAPVPLADGVWTGWDGRFQIRLEDPGDSWVGALGEEGAKSCRRAAESAGIPRAVLPALPAIMDKHGILAVPPVGWALAGTRSGSAAWVFSPACPLAGAGFRLVRATARTM